jgi:drug/metabolite transporter (DMT)-like permease
LAESSRSLTYAALAVLILIWGTTWAVIRIGLRGLPPFTGVAIRFGIAAIVLFAVARAFGVRPDRDRRARVLGAVNAALAFSLSYGVVYWAEQWVPSGLASVLFSTFPLMVAGLAHFALPGERIQPASAAGILVGFLGVLVIFSEDLAALGGQQTVTASIVFLLSPLAAAVANVVVKRWGKGVHPLSLTAPPMAATAVVMGVLAVIFERDRQLSFDASSVGALLYLAIAGTAVTFFLYFWLLDRLPATRLSLITYAIPVVAVTVGTLGLGEPFTRRMFMGSGLVLVGVSLAVGLSRGRKIST